MSSSGEAVPVVLFSETNTTNHVCYILHVPYTDQKITIKWMFIIVFDVRGIQVKDLSGTSQTCVAIIYAILVQLVPDPNTINKVIGITHDYKSLHYPFIYQQKISSGLMFSHSLYEIIRHILVTFLVFCLYYYIEYLGKVYWVV